MDEEVTPVRHVEDASAAIAYYERLGSPSSGYTASNGLPALVEAPGASAVVPEFRPMFPEAMDAGA
ncbi:hypothetical protein [Streptomyces sp. NPDC086010]|uniref:hypothetical protein n=1 Tax=Streptomyces sp. NPDC086010 TaxID=3365745 RepID=UPI0037D1F472